MELEELKNQWSILTERLQKSEQINGCLLKDVLTHRVTSTWNRFICYTLVSILICTIVLMMFIIHHDIYNQRCYGAPCSETVCVILGIMLADQIIQLIFLCYRNLAEENITRALHRILIYRKWMQIETIAGITVLCILLPIVMYWRNIHQTWFYVFGILLGLVGLGLSIFIHWYYMKNLRNIQQNLKELKEFEQETEN